MTSPAIIARFSVKIPDSQTLPSGHVYQFERETFVDVELPADGGAEMRAFLEGCGLTHVEDAPTDPLWPTQVLPFDRLKAIMAERAEDEDMEPAAPGVQTEPPFVDAGGVCYVRGSNSA